MNPMQRDRVVADERDQLAVRLRCELEPSVCEWFLGGTEELWSNNGVFSYTLFDSRALFHCFTAAPRGSVDRVVSSLE
jgi:hypothetical protein